MPMAKREKPRIIRFSARLLLVAARRGLTYKPLFHPACELLVEHVKNVSPKACEDDSEIFRSNTIFRAFDAEVLRKVRH